MTDTILLADLLALTEATLPEIAALTAEATEALKAKVSRGGKVSNAALEEDQFTAHALAWLATYNQSLIQLRGWAGRVVSCAGSDLAPILAMEKAQVAAQVPLSSRISPLAQVTGPACSSTGVSSRALASAAEKARTSCAGAASADVGVSSRAPVSMGTSSGARRNRA